LLAVVRNIKIDLDATQLFTPRQGLGFAAFCNFVWIGFYPWSAARAGSSIATLLLLAAFIFYVVGIGVLPSRERVRRAVRDGKSALSEGAKWLGPIGLMLIGALVTLVVIVALADQNQGLGLQGVAPAQGWFFVLYFTAWVGRDLFFLQWMKVRPVRSPLRKAILYLFVFYISTSILFRSSITSALPQSAAAPACVTPLPLMRTWLGSDWEAALGVWLMALVMQLGAAGIFAYLFRQQVVGLATRPQPAPPSGPAQFSSRPA
jgi:hypothetical protein